MAGDIDIVIGAQDQATAVLNRVSSSIGQVASLGASIGASFAIADRAIGALAIGFESLKNGVIESIQNIDKLTETAKGLDETVGNLQRFQFAADQLGNLDADKAIGALQKVQRLVGSIAIGDNQAGEDVFAKLQIDANALSLQGPVDQFRAIQEAIAGIANPVERAAVAQQLFGKSAAEILPILKASRSEFESMLQKADQLGFAIDQAGVDAIARMNDELDEAKKSLEAIYQNVAIELAPSVEGVADAFNHWVENTKKLNKELGSTNLKLDEAVKLAAQGALFNLDVYTGVSPEQAIKPIINDMVGNVADALKKGLAGAILGDPKEREAINARDTKAEQLESRRAEIAERELVRSQKESQNVLDRLQKDIDVSIFGKDTVQMWEDMAKATTLAEMEAIADLYQQRSEMEKQAIETREAELRKNANDKFESDRIDDILKRADDEKQKQLQLDQKLNEPPPGLQAVESRLLTRGSSENDYQKQIADTAKKQLDKLAKIDQNLERDKADKQTIVFQNVA